MNQKQIERAVAAATGESLGTIRRRGFSIVAPPREDADEHFVAKDDADKLLTADRRRADVGNSAA